MDELADNLCHETIESLKPPEENFIFKLPSICKGGARSARRQHDLSCAAHFNFALRRKNFTTSLQKKLPTDSIATAIVYGRSTAAPQLARSTALKIHDRPHECRKSLQGAQAQSQPKLSRFTSIQNPKSFDFQLSTVNFLHSYLSAVIGSTRVACRAGT
jgi:hypothetical protein